MSKRSKPGQGVVALVTSDRASGLLAARRIEEAGMKPEVATAGRDGLIPSAAKLLSGKPSACLIDLGPGAGKPHLNLCKELVGSGLELLAWSFGASSSKPEERDDWLVERLLEQKGAIVSPCIQTLIEALKVVCLTGRPSPGSVEIRLKGRRTGILARLAAELDRNSVDTSKRPSKKKRENVWCLEHTERGEIVLLAGAKGRVTLRDPASAASAMALLVEPGSEIEQPAVKPKTVDAEMIVRPPARLLSEPTSKRLASCFGIKPGPERLCKSATEAARYASTLEGPVVLKLARPELENKLRSNAVRTGVQGQASVRRAFHEIRSFASSLGPPEALGVLVAKQVDLGCRIWTKMEDHPALGRLILIGTGDAVSNNPATALFAPCTAGQALRALISAGVAPRGDIANKLATALTLFSHMAHELGPRISRAEIHPLVATEKDKFAMALDVSVAIAAY